MARGPSLRILFWLCRLCCNPHIFSWCLLDGCMRHGSMSAFASDAGFQAADGNHASGHGNVDQAKRRCGMLLSCTVTNASGWGLFMCLAPQWPAMLGGMSLLRCVALPCDRIPSLSSVSERDHTLLSELCCLLSFQDCTRNQRNGHSVRCCSWIKKRMI
jgi:hypothetical protein